MHEQPTNDAPVTNEDEYEDLDNQTTDEIVDDLEEDDSTEDDSDEEVIEPEKPAKRKWKYKADDEEIEEELDDDEIVQRLSLSKAAQKRMSQAAVALKNIEAKEQRFTEVFNGFKNNPRVLFEHAGIKGQDYWDWVTREMERFVEEQYLTDDERDVLNQERHQAELEEQAAKAKEAADLEKVQKLIMHVSEEVETEVVDALNKLNVPKTKAIRDRILIDTVKEMITEHYKAVEENREPKLTMEKAMKRALKYRETITMNHIRNLDPDQLIEYLGSDVVEKVSRAQAKKLQAKRTPPPTAPNTGSSPKMRRPDEVKKTETTDDLRRRLRGY